MAQVAVAQDLAPVALAVRTLAMLVPLVHFLQLVVSKILALAVEPEPVTPLVVLAVLE
jgi:hypothetical protein